MNKKIKLTSLLLALSLTLAACGTDDNDDNNQPDNNDEQTEESTSESSRDNNTDNKDDSNEPNNKNNNSNSSEDSDNQSVANKELNMADFDKSIEDAIDTAKNNFDGNLTEVGVSTHNNSYVYKIELESDTEEYEVSLDVNDLSVVKEETEKEDDIEDNKYFDYKDLVKAEDAINTAKDQVSGQVEKWSTDFDNGNLYYEVSIIQDNGEDVDVIIDAYSGDFVKIDD